MKIISNSALRAFAAQHPQADEPLQGWRRVIEKNRFGHWAELKATFNAIDKVGELTVFDIGGNKYRLIAYIRFEKQIVYINGLLGSDTNFTAVHCTAPRRASRRLGEFGL